MFSNSYGFSRTNLITIKGEQEMADSQKSTGIVFTKAFRLFEKSFWRCNAYCSFVKKL